MEESDNQKFEVLCLKGKKGYCYEEDLLVEVHKSNHFDDAVIRLITKCGSVLTQIRSLGSDIEKFSVNAVNTIKSIGNQSVPIFGGKIGLAAISNIWKTCQTDGYTGVVALARIKSNAIPKNGCREKYNLHDFVLMLMYHIHGNFMFQDFCPEFVKTPIQIDDGQDFLFYIAYSATPSESKPFSPSKKLCTSLIDRSKPIPSDLRTYKNENLPEISPFSSQPRIQTTTPIVDPISNYSPQKLNESSSNSDNNVPPKFVRSNSVSTRSHTRLYDSNNQLKSTSESVQSKTNDLSTAQGKLDSNQPLSGRVLKREAKGRGSHRRK